jgi:2-hydroxy-3-oxopropionate reductase
VIATSRSAGGRAALAAVAVDAGLDRGLELAPSAAAAASALARRMAGGRSGVLLLALPSGTEVAQVCARLDPPAGRLVVVDTSTTSPDEAVAVHARLAERGVGFLDAPVSGGPTGARAGTLSIMVGGGAADHAAARPILNRLAVRVVACGDVGAGQVVKACNQLVVTATIVTAAEALLLARTCGVDPGRAREALLGGYAASRVLELHGERMLRRDWQPGGRARLHAKDIGIIRALAAGSVTPAFDATAGWIEALARRDGEIDHSAVLTLLEHAAGQRLDAERVGAPA